MRGEDKPYELPPLSSTDDDAADGGSPVEVKGRGGTAVLATTPIPPAIPLGPPPAVVSIAQGLAVTASKQQISTPPVPPQINLSRLQPEPPQATPTPPSSARSKAAGAAAARGGRKQTAPASVIAVAEAASLAGAGGGVATVVVQPQPPPTTHPRPPPVRHG